MQMQQNHKHLNKCVKQGRDHNMKKIILLLILVLTSGCTVDYNLVIDKKNTLNEEITIKSENNQESYELYNDPWPTKAYYSDADSGDYPEKLNGVEYYKEEKYLENNFYHKKLTHSSIMNKFNDINSIKLCYEDFYVTNNEDNTITLATTSTFLCMENYPNLNQVNINIKVANPVVSSNASSVDGKNYKWTITRDNYETSGIIITFKKDNVGNGDYASNILLALGVLGTFLIFIGGVIFYNIKKNK